MDVMKILARMKGLRKFHVLLLHAPLSLKLNQVSTRDADIHNLRDQLTNMKPKFSLFLNDMEYCREREPECCIADEFKFRKR